MAASRDEQNLYERLGVARDATPQQIESALKEKKDALAEQYREMLIDEPRLREEYSQAEKRYNELERLVQFHLLNPTNKKKYDDDLSSTAPNSPNADAEKGKESTPWWPGSDMERPPAVPNPIIALLAILLATGKKTGRTPQGALRWALGKLGISPPGLKELAEKLKKAFERSNDPNASQHSAGSTPATLTLTQDYSEELEIIAFMREYFQGENPKKGREFLEKVFRGKDEQAIDELIRELATYEASEEALAEIRNARLEIEEYFEQQEALADANTENSRPIPVAVSNSPPQEDPVLVAAARTVAKDIERKQLSPTPFGRERGGSFEEDEEKSPSSPRPGPRPNGGST